MAVKGFKPRYSSNSGIFEKRGDPWVTQREGIKEFQRNLETEDAERDFDHRFHETGETFGKPKVAQVRQERHEPRPEKTDDPARRKASIARRMNMRIAARAARIEVPAPERHFKPCPGCKAARCIADTRCYGALK